MIRAVLRDGTELRAQNYFAWRESPGGPNPRADLGRAFRESWAEIEGGRPPQVEPPTGWLLTENGGMAVQFPREVQGYNLDGAAEILVTNEQYQARQGFTIEMDGREGRRELWSFSVDGRQIGRASELRPFHIDWYVGRESTGSFNFGGGYGGVSL